MAILPLKQHNHIDVDAWKHFVLSDSGGQKTLLRLFQNGMQDDPHNTHAMTTNGAISDPTIRKPNDAPYIQKYFDVNKKNM